MLGQVDQDDSTNLPAGCADVCRNTDFTRDSPGVTAAGTRAGNCMIMQGADSPGTGLWDFQYEPETDAEDFFQMPLRFTLAGNWEQEKPVGSGRMQAIAAGMFTLPTKSHAIATQAGNKLWTAYSTLKKPTAWPSCFDPKTLNTDPMGMKAYGFRWVPRTFVYAGEVCTPSNASAGFDGNGHTYQAQNDGWTSLTAAGEPAWPTNEGGEVSENGLSAGQAPVLWKELTMVIANRLPEPAAAALTLVAGGGGFVSGRDVYIFLTLKNGIGETTAGTVAKVTTTAAGQGVQVTIPALAAMAGWLSQLASPYAVTTVGVYEADVASGAGMPAQSTFELVGTFAPGSTPVVGGSAAGSTAPLISTARITGGYFPTPTVQAILTREAGEGTFAAGRDVYFRLAWVNANGETPLGPSNYILDTNTNDAVLVEVDAQDEYPQLKQVNVYEADVETGAAEPPISAYRLAGTYAIPTPSTAMVTTTAAGKGAETTNGTGAGGDIVADTEDGGANGTQGYRFAVPCWVNRNETFSGFTRAAVSKYIVDEDGWEIAAFNVAVGPVNVVARAVNWSVADSTQSGPFFWIGLLNLQDTTQNVVYPKSFKSDGFTMIPTLINDNVTTSGVFNFTDEYLKSANSTTDRLRVTGAQQAIRVDYLKSAGRTALAGVPGYESGLWISLGGDYESFYADTSPVPIYTNSGERCWGCVEFRNQIYYMRERSCGVITPGTGDPASWDVTERWNEVGPCGPRAFDACGDFIIFVHRSGVYRYDGSGSPDLMTKEIPRMWGFVDWSRAETVCCTIDTDTHTVRMQMPVGLNGRMEFCLSYLEGWLNPIHFSTYAQREVSQEASRRWSFNDVSAYICRRIYRTVSIHEPLPLAPDGTTQKTSDFYISQLAYTSTIADGLVNARTPGRYDDNGGGIDWKYCTISAQAMQKPSKPEGVITSAIGNGPINPTFIPGRQRVDGPGYPQNALRCLPMDLTPDGQVDYTRKPERRLGEYWKVLYDNGKQPGVWGSIKKIMVYVIPVKAARGQLETGR